jgi:hypothetical protein
MHASWLVIKQFPSVTLQVPDATVVPAPASLSDPVPVPVSTRFTCFDAISKLVPKLSIEQL